MIDRLNRILKAASEVKAISMDERVTKRMELIEQEMVEVMKDIVTNGLAEGMKSTLGEVFELADLLLDKDKYIDPFLRDIMGKPPGLKDDPPFHNISPQEDTKEK